MHLILGRFLCEVCAKGRPILTRNHLCKDQISSWLAVQADRANRLRTLCDTCCATTCLHDTTIAWLLRLAKQRSRSANYWVPPARCEVRNEAYSFGRLTDGKALRMLTSNTQSRQTCHPARHAREDGRDAEHVRNTCMAAPAQIPCAC